MVIPTTGGAISGTRADATTALVSAKDTVHYQVCVQFPLLKGNKKPPRVKLGGGVYYQWLWVFRPRTPPSLPVLRQAVPALRAEHSKWRIGCAWSWFSVVDQQTFQQLNFQQNKWKSLSSSRTKIHLLFAGGDSDVAVNTVLVNLYCAVARAVDIALIAGRVIEQIAVAVREDARR